MSRRPARFTQAEIDNAMAVAKKTGMTVEILVDGTIRMVPDSPIAPTEILPARTYIYFVQATESRRIKIGFTARLGNRLLAISTYCPEPVQVLAVMIGTIQEEFALHKRFAASRVTGEWFSETTELLDFIGAAEKVPHDT